jgi:hypothetical protein
VSFQLPKLHKSPVAPKTSESHRAKLILRSSRALVIVLSLLAVITAYQNCAQTPVPGEDLSSTGAGSTTGASANIKLTSYSSDTMVLPGGTLRLTVAARSLSGAGLNYQWFYNGSAIPNATGTRLIIPGATAETEGSYNVVISDGSNRLTTNSIYIEVGYHSLTITAQPESLSVQGGSTPCFEVTAVDSPGNIITYSWYKDGSPISVKTPNLCFSNVNRTNHAGKYYVKVSNGVDKPILSDMVTLSVSGYVQGADCLDGSIYGGHCYRYYGGKANFIAAISLCNQLGGYLAKVNDNEKNEMIANLIWEKNNRQGIVDTFIGLDDCSHNGTYLWRDGTQSFYLPWNNDQPDHNNGECCIEMTPNKRWNDLSKAVELPYVCEFE